MNMLLVGVCVLAATGILAALSGRRATAGGSLAVVGVAVAAVLGVVPCVRVVAGGPVEILRIPWQVPGGSFYVQLDALAAFFILPILLVSLACAVYGLMYMRGHAPHKEVGSSWCFFNILIASMIVVVLARNAVLFLTAWEVMAVASFFLVAFDDEDEDVRSASWTYLIATHLGTAALLLMFGILGAHAGSLDFDRFGGLAVGATHVVFVLAVIGFGAKAGFVPFHVWLPEAHPAAPSHVSAVMSGLMIKTGIYALLRIVVMLGVPPIEWGWAMILIGLASGIGGVLFALAQHDLKRLLAYHSVENIGIIALGLGIGMVGWSTGLEVVSVLGFAGGILHVLNHGIFKSLLFLGAGSVHHATRTRDMDHLGGLLQPMPATGASFLIGSAAISGLPPLNGFVSEFLIFLAASMALVDGNAAVIAPAVTVIASLALISGLAAACFTKAFGCVFLGSPRSSAATAAHEPPLAMRAPMIVLAACCGILGLGAPWVVPLLAAPIAVIRPDMASRVTSLLASGAEPVTRAIQLFAIFILATGLLALLRSRLLRGRAVGRAGTWDCGYAAPTARMQYTSSSFAQPLTRLFRSVLRTKRLGGGEGALFPARASFASETPDICTEGFYRPLFGSIGYVVARLRVLQHGNIHVYILYIAITLLALLIWKMT